MPTARKLPSGNWRCKIYLYKDSDGKEHYKSFTAKTKKEAEFLAIQYANQIHKDGEEQTFEEVYRFMTELKKPSISPNTHRGLVRDIDSSYFDSVRNMPINKIDDVMDSQIAEAMEEIKRMNQQVMDIQGVLQCPNCGKKVPAGNAFCSDCGAKMEEIIVDATVVSEETVTEEPVVEVVNAEDVTVEE